MQRLILILIFVLFAPVILNVGHARAGVVIKVRALNPLQIQEKAVIKYPLPKQISPGNILGQKVIYSQQQNEDQEPRKSQLNMVFDEVEGLFFIDDEVVLNAKEVVTIEVHVEDVWVIEGAKIERLNKQVNDLLQQWERQETADPNGETAEGSGPEGPDDGSVQSEIDPETTEAGEDETHEVIVILKEQILGELQQIVERQDANKIIKVGVQRHIQAFEENVAALRQIQQDILMLTNLIEFEGLPEQLQDETSNGPDIPQEPQVENATDKSL